ncbi:MAG: hypothetical protein ACFFCI_06990 [Promethearchaeota archaeon]
MSIEDELNGYRSNSRCEFCGEYGYIEIYRNDWEDFEEIECIRYKKLSKEPLIDFRKKGDS